MNNINLNPTRDGILRALNLMQANIQTNNKRTINGELMGDLEIKTSELKGCELTNNFSRLMIDEYPILSVAAAFAKSPSIFKGLGELKVKESNRLELIRHNLNNCGIYCKVNGEDLYIDPTKKINTKNNQIKTNNDHRIAMSFAIMGMKLGIELKIRYQQRNIFNENLFKWQIPMGMLAFVYDYPDPSNMLGLLWRSQPKGYARHDWLHPHFDNLLDRANTHMDAEVRYDLYTQAESILAEEAGAVFLFHPVVTELRKPYLRGIKQDRYGRVVPIISIQT